MEIDYERATRQPEWTLGEKPAESSFRISLPVIAEREPRCRAERIIDFAQKLIEAIGE